MRQINVDTFERTFTLLVTCNPRATSVGRTARLNALFDDLRRSDPLRDPEETMELIWAIWIDHFDQRASHRMVAAVEAIAAGARDLAKPILDSLVNEHPEWAEAWNKRATLAFIEKRDNDSIADIAGAALQGNTSIKTSGGEFVDPGNISTSSSSGNGLSPRR